MKKNNHQKQESNHVLHDEHQEKTNRYHQGRAKHGKHNQTREHESDHRKK